MLTDIKTHTYDDNALGPIGEHDAILLKSIAMYLHEPAVLEFGTADGHSAAMWLSAGASSVTSVDLETLKSAHALDADPRVTFVACSQQDYVPSRMYDIVFIDASHSLELNIETFKRIKSWISPQGLLLIHDTGLWARDHMTEVHNNFPRLPENEKFQSGVVHQQGEQEFVDWLVREGVHCVTLGSIRGLRHGITICSLSLNFQ